MDMITQTEKRETMTTTLELELARAAKAVTNVNRDNGWFDRNPKVDEFMEWFAGYMAMPVAVTGDHVVADVRNRVEAMFGSRTFGDDIALLHSEASEALEAFRDGGIEDATSVPHEANNYNPKPEGVGSELADVLVRLLDTCSRYDINLGAEFERKLQYNATRGHRHGGKTL